MYLNGLIGFTEGRGLFSKLIKFFGDAPISHCLIGFLDEFVIEAVHPVVKVSRFSKYKKKAKRVEFYRIKCFTDFALTPKILSLMKRYLDVPYGWKQIIGYAWVIAKKVWTGRYVKNPFEKGPDEIICAEFLLYFLRDKLNMREFEKIDVNDPKFMSHIYNIVRGSDQFEKVTITFEEQ